MISEYYYREGFIHPVDELNSVEFMNEKIQKHIMIAKKDYLYRNGHYIPQYDYVYNSPIHDYNHGNDESTSRTKSRVKYVLKYEHLDQDFEQLMKEYNLPIQIHSNSKIDGNKNASYVVESTRKRKQNAILSKNDLFPTTRKLIEEYYGNDFREFGYRKIGDTNITHD